MAEPESTSLDTMSVALEQAVLGAILTNNDAYALVAPILPADAFADPVHREVWAAIGERIAAGTVASPLTLRLQFDQHEGMRALGGVSYLARLVGACVGGSQVVHVARDLRDAWVRRQGADAAERAMAALRGDATEPTAATLARLEGEILALDDTAAEGPRDRWLAAPVAAAMADVWAAYHAETPLVGVTTGLPSLDRVMGGWRPGRLAILGGRPGMGKSAILLFLAWSAARAGRGVHVCSLEMSPEEMSHRLVSLQAWHAYKRLVPYSRIMRADLDQAEAECVARAAAEIGGLPIRMSGPDVRDVGALTASVRRSQVLMEDRGAPLGLVIVDYLQLVRPPTRRQNVVHEIGDVSAALKALSMRSAAPVLAAAQLSRQVESRQDKRPLLSDLRDSGAIEQDADIVMFAYRPEYYLAREAPPKDDAAFAAHAEAVAASRDILEIEVAKNRQGGTERLTLYGNMSVNAIAEVTP